MRNTQIELIKYVFAITRQRSISIAIVWLVVTLPILLDTPRSLFVWINFAVFLIFDAVVYRIKQLPDAAFDDPVRRRAAVKQFSTMWFVYAIQWGIIASYVFYTAEHRYLLVTVSFIMAISAIGGFVLWMFSQRAGKLFFVLIYTPPFCTLLYVGTVDSITAAAYILLSFFGVYRLMSMGTEMVRNTFLRFLESSRSAAKYKERSQVDALTRIYNRHFFDLKFREEVLAANAEGTALGVVLIDIDHFKRINDNFGHVVGDRCLQKVAALMGPLVRADDSLCRYGGEEFVVLLPRVAEEKIVAVSERIRSEIERCRLVVDGHTIALTVSIGASVSEPGDAGSDLFQQADKALYRAKADGRNKVVLYDAALADAADSGSRAIDRNHQAPV